MSHTLILLRHGKSDWDAPASDRHRPLAKRGRRQAPEAGRWLEANLGAIDRVLVSPAVRAESTWELAAAEFGDPPPAEVAEDLYAFSSEGVLEVVRGLDEGLGTVVLVGHNPALEDLAELLTGGFVWMPTSAIAVIALPGTWAEADAGAASLVTSGRPPAPYDDTVAAPS